MSGQDGTSGNAEQVEFWNGAAGERWVRNQQNLDVSLAPMGEAALAAAAVKPGEHVIDVGCGCGATALTLAAAVGPTGGVFGVDVSAPMLALARARAAGITQATFALADASAFRFEPRHDLVFSRFGVMFFRDPVNAFANVRRALRPGGRLAFVCWGPKPENPWFTIPVEIALRMLPPPEPTAPDAPGPFAFADRGRIEGILAAAGFGDVAIERSSPEYVVGPDPEAAATIAVDTGPVSRLLVDTGDITRARIRDALRDALVAHQGPRGVALGTSTWIVTARSL